MKIDVVLKTKVKLSAFIANKRGYEKITSLTFTPIPNGVPRYLIGEEGFFNENEVYYG